MVLDLALSIVLTLSAVIGFLFNVYVVIALFLAKQVFIQIETALDVKSNISRGFHSSIPFLRRFSLFLNWKYACKSKTDILIRFIFQKKYNILVFYLLTSSLISSNRCSAGLQIIFCSFFQLGVKLAQADAHDRNQGKSLSSPLFL